MNLEEFYSQHVDIIKQEMRQGEFEFGFFPFIMLVERKCKRAELCSMQLEGVASYYNAVHGRLHRGAPRVFLAIDFPANSWINTDHVMCYEFSEGGDNVEMIAYPYNVHSGEVAEPITDSDYFKEIYDDVNLVFQRGW